MGLKNTLKHYGREVVLPVSTIKSFARQILTENSIAHITDFGAGTLFWSEWFADELKDEINNYLTKANFTT